MKTQSTSWILLIAAAVVAQGCDRPSSPPGTPTTTTAPNTARLAAVSNITLAPGPRITFDKTVHDLGTMSETQSASVSFQFTNTGDQPLVIEKVNTSCSCTSSKLEKNQYQPGERGHLDITFKPTGAGNTPSLINVFSNARTDSSEPFVRLQLLANVQAFLDVQPRILNTGVLAYQSEHTFAVSVSCPPDPNFTIQSITTSNPHVHAVLRPAAAGQTARIIDLVVDSSTPWGGLFSWIDVTASGKPAPDAQPIAHTSKTRIQGQIFGNLRAEPDTFRFGAKPGERFSRTIRLKSANGEPFEVRSAVVILSDIPGTRVDVVKVSPYAYDIIMTATGDTLRSLAQGTVAVHTTVPGEEQIELPIAGVIRDSDPSVR